MDKIDGFRIVELVSLTLFGFIGYLYTIWQWTNNISMVIVFAVLFFVIVAISVIGYKVYKEEYSKKSKKEMNNNAKEKYAD